MTTRRQVLLSAAAAFTAATLRHSTLAADAAAERAAKPLRLLILGGTRFLGLHMTELALARGHTVTFFNRGRTKTDRFAQVERIVGDRNGQLQGLKSRSFDAVIDNSGFVPRHVRLSAQLLAAEVPQYVFVSSISVYPNFAKPRGEDSPVGKLTDESNEKVDDATYGPLKALCEHNLRKVYGKRATILRPGLIVGPDDNTDRFTYWPARAARGGDFAAPGAAGDAIQYIDARDFAAFALRCIERGTHGTFNVVTPPRTVSMGAMLEACVQSAAAQAKPATPPRPVWLPPAFLAAQKIQPWSDVPVWLPASGDTAAFAATPVSRALAAGLRCRPVAETVDATLTWHLARPAAQRDSLKAGLTSAREAELLKAWRSRA